MTNIVIGRRAFAAVGANARPRLPGCRRYFTAGVLVVLFSNCAASGMQRPASADGAVAPQKVQIERADQLPRHVYRVATTATALLQDDAQFAGLAKQLEAD